MAKLIKIPILKMGRAYLLTKEIVLSKVTKNMGNYVLGYVRMNKRTKANEFVIRYVGRSDTNLQFEIIQQGIRLKKDLDGKQLYTHFKFTHRSETLRDNYIKECTHYHLFKDIHQLDNVLHPARPKGYTQSEMPCKKITCLN